MQTLPKLDISYDLLKDHNNGHFRMTSIRCHIVRNFHSSSSSLSFLGRCVYSIHTNRQCVPHLIYKVFENNAGENIGVKVPKSSMRINTEWQKQLIKFS